MQGQIVKLVPDPDGQAEHQKQFEYCSHFSVHIDR